MSVFEEEAILQALREDISIADQVDDNGNTLLTRAIEFGSHKVFSYLFENDKLIVPNQKPLHELLIHCPHASIVYFCLYENIIDINDVEFDFVSNSSLRYLYDIGMLYIDSGNTERAQLMLDEILKYDDDVHIRAATILLRKGVYPTKPVKSQRLTRLVEMYTKKDYDFHPLHYPFLDKDTRSAIKAFETTAITKEAQRVNLDLLPIELRQVIYYFLRN